MSDALREALRKIKDLWVQNITNDNMDDYEEGYDDGLKACHDVAVAVLEKEAKSVD